MGDMPGPTLVDSSNKAAFDTEQRTSRDSTNVIYFPGSFSFSRGEGMVNGIRISQQGLGNYTTCVIIALSQFRIIIVLTLSYLAHPHLTAHMPLTPVIHLLHAQCISSSLALSRLRRLPLRASCMNPSMLPSLLASSYARRLPKSQYNRRWPAKRTTYPR